MAIIKCKMCGGDLKQIEGASTAECEYCGSVQTVPKADDEKKLVQFERADRLRRQCEFDKAASIYENIVAEFRYEAEAYWGLVLCKYGVEYVDDPASGRKVPTCHRSSFDSIMTDPDLELALENADVLARRVYREEAKQLEEIRKGIVAVSSSEQPYDIFICYKETDANGDRTLDSVLAQDLYDALIAKDYRVFFARISLEDKLGMAYEPYIFAALNSAKIMLVVGTDYEYFNAVWVKNEWSRFLKLMAKDKGKHLIPCYKGIDAYDMPKEFQRLQAQDLGKVGATQDLMRGIGKLLPKDVQPPIQQSPAQQPPAQQPMQPPVQQPYHQPYQQPQSSLDSLKGIIRDVGRDLSRDIGSIIPKGMPTGMNARGPVIIKNVCSIGTRMYDEYWPKGPCQTVFNYDEVNVISFNLSVDPYRLTNRRTVRLGAAFYHENGNKITDEEITLDWQNNFDRLAKTFNIRGKDGSVVPTGRYRVEFWVDESAIYEYRFTVTSYEEINRQRPPVQQMPPVRPTQPIPNYMLYNRCSYCGGPFKGLLIKRCAVCGREKNY